MRAQVSKIEDTKTIGKKSMKLRVFLRSENVINFQLDQEKGQKGQINKIRNLRAYIITYALEMKRIMRIL